MPTYPHIDSYYEQLRELIEFGGATNEENIRPAFQNCLVRLLRGTLGTVRARARAALRPQQQT